MADDKKLEKAPPEPEVEIVELEAGESPPEDERVGASETEHDAEEHVVSAEEEGAETEEERASIRERRREERRLKRDRQRKAIARDRVEKNFLLQRNENLEKRLMSLESRQSGTEEHAIDTRLAGLDSQLSQVDGIIAAAVSAGNGDDVVKANRIRDAIQDDIRNLKGMKGERRARVAAPVAEEQRAPAQPQIDPQVVKHAQEFYGENKDWYDPHGRNEESAIVLAIDSALTQEGFDPASEDYWDELRTRAARRLPEKFSKGKAKVDEDEDDEDEPPPQKRSAGPRLSAGGPSASKPGGKTTFYVSPERKQAMIEAGVWDDPVLRTKYVRRYQEWDQQNTASRR